VFEFQATVPLLIVMANYTISHYFEVYIKTRERTEREETGFVSPCGKSALLRIPLQFVK